MRKDNAKLADDVQTLQNSALDMKDKLLHAKLDNAKLADYVQKLQNDESNMKERLKIRGEKVDELEVQLKTQMLKHKTELETLSKQLQSTSTENNALSKENGMLKDAIDKIGILIRHLWSRYNTINTKQIVLCHFVLKNSTQFANHFSIYYINN